MKVITTETSATAAIGKPVKHYKAVSFECGSTETFIASSDEDAMHKTMEWLRDGDWGDEPGYVSGSVVEVDADEEPLGEEIVVEVEANNAPAEPACIGPEGEEYEEHDWQTPIDLVHGIDQNPGVFFASRGRIRVHYVCAQCGTHRHVVTESLHGQYPRIPEVISYKEPDEESIEWVKSLV